MKKIEKIQKKIEAFLKERVKLDNAGCLADVSQEQVNEFEEIIDLILDAKYQRDYDNWVPLFVHVVNVTSHEPMHYCPIPYHHKNNGDIKQALSVAAMNASIANDKLNTIIRIMEIHDRQEKEKHEKEAAAKKARIEAALKVNAQTKKTVLPE